MISNPPASETPTILSLPRELRDIIIGYSFLERDPVSIELPNYPTPPPADRLGGTKYASHGQLLLHYFVGQSPVSNPTRFKHVHTKFYVLKDDETRFWFWWHNCYRWGDDGPISGWELYRILELFLQCGPLSATGAREDTHILIDMLELDVCTRAAIPESQLGPPNIPTEGEFVWPTIESLSERLLSLRKETGVDCKMHPDYLVVYLHYLFEKLRFNPEGRVIYERVGVAGLLLDGIRLHQWNLDERLKEMYCKDEEQAR